jgi:hypothetical protein
MEPTIDKSNEQVLMYKIKNDIDHIRFIVNNSKNKDFHNEMLEDTLIKEEIEVIYAIVTDIYEHFATNTLYTCLHHVYQTVNEIVMLICEIDTKLFIHSNKYFSTWRSPDVYNEILRIKKCSSSLQHRSQRLLKVANK